MRQKNTHEASLRWIYIAEKKELKLLEDVRDLKLEKELIQLKKEKAEGENTKMYHGCIVSSTSSHMVRSMVLTYKINTYEKAISIKFKIKNTLLCILSIIAF